MTRRALAFEAAPAGAAMSTQLELARSAIERRLEAALPLGEAAGCPPRLAEAMRYAVLGGGKRLRPVLCLLAAEAIGADWDCALGAACAVELIHCYSLVHDDLPAMDDDDLRRGRPTVHKAFDEATAILAGDALLTLAFEVLAQGTRPTGAAAEATVVLARAAGASGMVGGQMADLEAEGRPLAEGSVELLKAIHRRKTGALLQAAPELGAIAAGADPDRRRAIAAYGRRLGLAFQILDDVLDAVGDEVAAGKRLRKDDAAGKWTYPAFLGVDESRSWARAQTERAVDALQPLGDRGAALGHLAWHLLERDR